MQSALPVYDRRSGKYGHAAIQSSSASSFEETSLQQTRGWHAVSLMEPARIIHPALFKSFNPEADYETVSSWRPLKMMAALYQFGDCNSCWGKKYRNQLRMYWLCVILGPVITWRQVHRYHKSKAGPAKRSSRLLPACSWWVASWYSPRAGGSVRPASKGSRLEWTCESVSSFSSIKALIWGSIAFFSCHTKYRPEEDVRLSQNFKVRLKSRVQLRLISHPSFRLGEQQKYWTTFKSAREEFKNSQNTISGSPITNVNLLSLLKTGVVA